MNERSKKIYAIIIAILLVLSIATSFLPSISVKAQTSKNITQTPWYDLIPTGDELFDLAYYDIDNANLSDEIKYGCNEGVITQDGNIYYSYIEELKSFLTDRDTYDGSFNGGHPLNDINIVTNNSELENVLENPDLYSYQLIITQTSSSFYISFYYSTDLSFPEHLFLSNDGGYVYDFTGTVKRFDLYLTYNNDSDHTTYSPNIFTQSNNSPYNSSQKLYQMYCTCPLYFCYVTNEYGSTYSNLNTSSNIQTFLNNGGESDFLIDRREYFSNYNGGGLNVDTDPESQNNVGVYDFDFYPSGDVTSGILNIENLQLSAKTSEMENVHLYALITYNFQCNGFYYEYGTNYGLVENYILKNMNTKPSRFNIRNVNILETTIELDDTSYQTFSSRTVMRDTGPTDGEKYSIYIEDGIPRSIDMYDLYGISNYCQFIASTQTTPKTKVENISSTVVTAFQVSCSIKVDYNDGQVSKTLATNTYDYFTGENYKYGFTSTDNNTSADDLPDSVSQGLQWINNGGFGDGVGGNTVNGGSNTNSNTNNPSFVNNNNPTITIENNNGGGWYPSGDDDTQEGGILAQFWAVWSTFEVIQHFTQAVSDNEFLSFIFSSELWQIPGMAIIIPSLVIMILVSILSTIVRFIRGN